MRWSDALREISATAGDVAGRLTARELVALMEKGTEGEDADDETED